PPSSPCSVSVPRSSAPDLLRSRRRRPFGARIGAPQLLDGLAGIVVARPRVTPQLDVDGHVDLDPGVGARPPVTAPEGTKRIALGEGAGPVPRAVIGIVDVVGIAVDVGPDIARGEAEKTLGQRYL